MVLFLPLVLFKQRLLQGYLALTGLQLERLLEGNVLLNECTVLQIKDLLLQLIVPCLEQLDVLLEFVDKVIGLCVGANVGTGLDEVFQDVEACLLEHILLLLLLGLLERLHHLRLVFERLVLQLQRRLLHRQQHQVLQLLQLAAYIRVLSVFQFGVYWLLLLLQHFFHYLLELVFPVVVSALRLRKSELQISYLVPQLLNLVGVGVV